jgi:lysophospholipase L1-like esterase
MHGRIHLFAFSPNFYFFVVSLRHKTNQVKPVSKMRAGPQLGVARRALRSGRNSPNKRFVSLPESVSAANGSVSVYPMRRERNHWLSARDTGATVIHSLGIQTAYLSQSGDQTGATTIPDATTVTERYFFTRIEVSSNNAGTIVALGDPITDGRGSTLDANGRWPDRLADRLHEQGQSLGVVNAGMAGNRILHDLPEMICGPSTLSRFDRDVLSVPGVKFVVLLQGVTDIGHPAANDLPEQAVSVEQVIGDLKQLIVRAHARHLKIFGATYLPGEGDLLYSEEAETKRKAVNEWIRTSKAFDAVIDFEAVVRDPSHPTRLRPEYDSGDHGHLNDAGYRALADSIDLKLFTNP